MSTTKKSISEKANGSKQIEKIFSATGEIEILNRQRQFPIDRQSAIRLAGDVLNRIGRRNSSLTISFIRDLQMQKLNREYRGIDKPTDVLSFAYGEVDDGFVMGQENHHLGDMVISVETAGRYALELGITFDREIEHLIIHGVLHLAGYDHEKDNGQMNRLEKKLRRELLAN